VALDEDAAKEATRLISRAGDLPVYTLEVPESCRSRCDKAGKKADFGECTFVEAKEAYQKASDEETRNTSVSNSRRPMETDKKKNYHENFEEVYLRTPTLRRFCRSPTHDPARRIVQKVCVTLRTVSIKHQGLTVAPGLAWRTP